MTIDFSGLPKDDLLKELRKRVDLRQGNAAEVFIGEVGVDLFMKLAQGKKFIRMSKDSYFRQLRVQAEKDFRDEFGLENMRGYQSAIVLSRYVGSYLSDVKKDIRGCIERLRPGIQGMEISHESCRVLRDFINREIPFFTVGMGHNFMSEPYFMFCFQGRDMFGGD